jgi:hypothetical protein
MPRKQILLLTALAILTVSVTSFLVAQTAPTAVKQANANASQVGRYQIVINPNVRADTILLDTETGNTWIQTQVTDVKDAPTIWVFRERVDNHQQFLEWSVRQAANESK